MFSQGLVQKYLFFQNGPSSSVEDSLEASEFPEISFLCMVHALWDRLPTASHLHNLSMSSSPTYLPYAILNQEPLLTSSLIVK